MTESAAVTATEKGARARFRENVLYLSEASGVSLRRAAGLADLAEATVRFWLNGRNDPTLGNMARLANAFGVELSDLFLDPLELRAKIEEEGLRPFVLRRPDTTKPRSSDRSAADEAKTGNGKVTRPMRSLLKTAA